jgi:activating signal cointegrator 1
LWIHAAAKEVDKDVISQMETFYRSRNAGKDQLVEDILVDTCLDEDDLDFPKDYPTSVLLGCVEVIDCLDRDTYLEQYPGGESESEYVLICENPQELFFKVAMQGQHKICQYDPLFSSSADSLSLLDKMDHHTHQTAKKVLLRRMQ